MSAAVTNSRPRKSFYPNFTLEDYHSVLFLSPEAFRVCTMLSFALRVPLFLKGSCLRGKFVSFFLFHQCIFHSYNIIGTVHSVALPS